MQARKQSSSPLPDVLYKYRPFSMRAVADMAANRVFLSSPSRFNDAYDCRIPWSGFLSADELKKLADNGGPFADALRRLHAERRDLFESGWQLNPDGFLYLRNLLSEHFSGLNNCGVCSFSAVSSDLKMWAHYGDSRQGFCLGFSTRYAPFSDAVPVDYVDDMREVDAYRMLSGNVDEDEAFGFLVTKADIWREEREYRIFADEPDAFIRYDEQAVRSITFGDRTAVEHMVISHSVLPAHVEFYVVSPTGNRYELDTLPVDRDVLDRYR